MQENLTADDEDRGGGLEGHQAAMGLDRVSIGPASDAAPAPDHFCCASLIERIVGFMERYN